MRNTQSGAFQENLSPVVAEGPLRRQRVLDATLALGLALVLITEVSSAVGHFSRAGLLTGWAVLAAAGTLTWRWRRSTRARPVPVLEASRRPMGRLATLVLGASAVVVMAEATVAVAAPPNTWDSMVYHMSRVAHWAHNHTVAHYPTHIQRQLKMPPLAEFAIAQLYILTGGDRLSNLVQWLSMVVSAVGVSLVARQLGAAPGGQVAASALAVGMPAAILEASSTKNDCMLAMWLVCVAWGLMEWRSRPDRTNTLRCAAALALALLTKATAYIYALPFCIWWAAAAARRRRTVGGLWLRMLMGALVVLAVNSGHWIRNWRLFGSPLGPASEGGYFYANEEWGGRALLSNVVKNLALHASTPLPGADPVVLRSLQWFHKELGISADDPRLTWRSMTFQVGPFSLRDDSGDPLHLLVAAAALTAVATSRRLRGDVERQRYGTCVGAAFLLFCLYLKWQPWHARLHLPLLVLSAPWCAAVLSARWPTWTVGAAGAVLLSGTPWLLFNPSRPAAGEHSVFFGPRIDHYFAERPELRRSYGGAADQLRARECARIGLVADDTSWEYPLWILMKNEVQHGWIEHVKVANPSAVAPLSSRGRPCAVFWAASRPPGLLRVRGSHFRRAWALGSNTGSVYFRDPSFRHPPLDFDGDGRSDPAIYDQGAGEWRIHLTSTDGQMVVQLGGPDYAAVPGDYDGDGKVDEAVYSASQGTWVVLPSRTGSKRVAALGTGFVSVPCDYDGDGKTDMAVYQPTTGLWRVRQSGDDASYSLLFVGTGYVPVPADYDGDGCCDIAVYHPASGLWYVRSSLTGTTLSIAHGGGGPLTPVPGDYDGDGKADYAVYHEPTGLWYIRLSTTGLSHNVAFGGTGYVPVPADYDGDGRADVAVYRAGEWLIKESLTGAMVVEKTEAPATVVPLSR